ncbi:MAG: metalloendopeptidase-like rane protein [Oscillospiraceae bacterium]|nr:metalloendopeptidase-like rane protein [Oscillospiraceae bacterium]
MRKKNMLFYFVSILLCVCILFNFIQVNQNVYATSPFIKWVDFNVPYSAMVKALNADIKAHNEKKELSWVDILAYLASKYGGSWKKYKAKDMDKLIQAVNQGDTFEELTQNMKNFDYFKTAYDAVLGGFVGEYQISQQALDVNPNPTMETKYGLKAYSPVAYGYGFSHYDDFGNSRSYGFKRKHLGNDLVGSTGTPIIAVESGYVEVAAWNKYGGWRIGIRSFDKKRYYYYAHLRKDRPFHSDIKEGQIVNAGDVIGYLGMTGYSDNENVNGMTVPHLHFGMQLIFDESQKEGNNEIWIDVYQIVNLLQKHRSPIMRDSETKEYYRKYTFVDPLTEQYKTKNQTDTKKLT